MNDLHLGQHVTQIFGVITDTSATNRPLFGRNGQGRFRQNLGNLRQPRITQLGYVNADTFVSQQLLSLVKPLQNSRQLLLSFR